MVEHQPSKLDTWVRFPSPALRDRYIYDVSVFCYIGNYLPLPLGEVAERSEDGEGEDGASVL